MIFLHKSMRLNAFKISLDYKAVLPICLSVFFILFCPFFLMLFILATLLISNHKYNLISFILFTLFIFVIYNIGKNVDGDLLSYINLQKAFASSSLNNLIDMPQNFSYESGSYRTSEFIGYSFYWFIANYISSGKITFSVVTTLLIYLPYILSLNTLSNYYKYPKSYQIILFLSFFFIGINFIQTTHVVRQYVSASLFVFSLSKYFTRRNLLFFSLAIISIGFHNSIIILYVPFLIIDKLNIYNIYLEKNRFWFLNLKMYFLLSVMALVIGYVFLNNPIYLLSDNGTISDFALIIDIVILFVALLIKDKIFENKFEFIFFLLYFIILSIVILFVSLNFLIPALRLYLYLEFLRPILLSAIVFRYFYKKNRSLFKITYIYLSISFFLLRFAFSPWLYYGKTGFSAFTINLFDIIKTI